MTRFQFQTMAALLTCVLSVDSAQGQIKIQVRPAQGAVQLFPGGRQAAKPSLIALLRQPAVQTELKLDDEQKKDIQDKIGEAQKESRELATGLRNATREERRKKFDEYRKKVQENTEKADKGLRQILTKPQQQRIDEIALQRQGLNALNNPDVIKKLKITDDQKKSVAETQQAMQKKRIQLSQDIRNGNLERGKYAEKIKELNEETEKKTLEVLSKEQREQFEKMKGKPFTFPQRGILRAVPAGRLKLQAKPIRIKVKGQQIQPKPATPKAAKEKTENAGK